MRVLQSIGRRTNPVNQAFLDSRIQPDELSSDDQVIIDSVENYLAEGLDLHRWWEDEGAQGRYEKRFELQRSFNRPAGSYGFFARARVHGREMPIMGNVQDMLYDQIKAPAEVAREHIEWTRGQLREFVLRYFMRVSSFRRPQAAVTGGGPPVPTWLSRISWCPESEVLREGFGFAQLYYKTLTGEIGKFSDTSRIVDLREVGEKYEWIILKVRIFNFSVPAKLLGPRGPELLFNLDEESYVVLSRAFIRDCKQPYPGMLGEYGIGYAFIKNPKPGFLAFGPGEFAAAIQLIQFRISESGEINVHMVFVVNRPEKVSSVSVDPLDWSLRLGEIASLGLAAPWLNPLRAALSRVPAYLGTFDPVLSYVDLMSFLTSGQSEEKLCICREELDRRFLLQHFMQHYETVAGALFTWRQIPDWLNTAALPRWVVMGRSS
jgi:hypothetical protein